MDLDDQLAALAAGELDDATARAVRARVARDPALARRLQRFHTLDAQLRVPADPSPMPADAVARLDAAVDAALDALPDAPLRDATGSDATGSSATGDAGAAGAAREDEVAARRRARAGGTTRAGDPAPDVQGGAAVVDLGRRRSTPRWAGPLLGTAAAMLAVVALAGPLTGGSDDEGLTASSEESSRVDESAGGADAADEAGTEEMSSESAADMASEALPEAEVQDGTEEAGSQSDAAGATGEATPAAASAPGDLLAGAPVRALATAAAAALLDDTAVVAAVPDATRREEQLLALAEAGSPLARCAAQVLADLDGAVLALTAVQPPAGGAPFGVVVVGPDGPTAVVLAPDGARCTELDRARG